ncbi:TPA: hypothetical protein ACSCX2_003510 [Aeromonas veronii]|uniref:hypothetical protein n=1 Tax=Aeromonas TaxID=642 RepID=UPI002247B59D|nr:MULTISPECIES: hypothetical protein [Aeromonas]EKP0294307.1 hypothetical protein [Aeromonas veronii]MCX0438923.1 hypothetical protein [Aeromonas veronii]
MRKVDKGQEPASLAAFKRQHPHARYHDLPNDEEGQAIRQHIREACTAEQFYLCAYCCQAISGTHVDTMNEHVEARDLAPNRTMDFSNMVASCRAPKQCDAAHGSQPLPLTPLMAECETELRFRWSGRVEGLTERARETIRVLNLGDTEQSNKALVAKRKQLVDSLIWTHSGDGPEQLVLEDDAQLLAMLIEDLSQPEQGKLEPFAPVLVNILRSQL